MESLPIEIFQLCFIHLNSVDWYCLRLVSSKIWKQCNKIQPLRTNPECILMNNDVMYWKTREYNGSIEINDLYVIQFGDGMEVTHFDYFNGTRLWLDDDKWVKHPIPLDDLTYIKLRAYHYDLWSNHPRLCDHTAKFYIDPLKQPIGYHMADFYFKLFQSLIEKL